MNEIQISARIAKYLPVLLLTGIILLLSAYMIYWGTQKEGYVVDEMFSMMEIRGDGVKRPYQEEDFYDVWRTASEMESTIGVTSEKAFSDINMLKEPYWSLLHIAYSFSPDEFSKWPSVILNIIIYICVIIVIYLLSLLFINNKYLALLPGLVWGVSSAAVNMVLFIRFYCFKTLICLLLTYFILLAIRGGFSKWRYLIIIAVLTYIGAFIHQYFYVYAFFLSALVCFFLLIKREFKQLFIFAGTMLAAVGIVQIVSRNIIVRSLAATTGRGAEAVEALIHGTTPHSDNYLERIKLYFELVCNHVFANINYYILLALLIALSVILIVAYIRKSGASINVLLLEQRVHFGIIIGGSSLLYLLMIARIAPYQEIRYIFCITPLIVILFVSLFIRALRVIGFSRNVSVFVMISVLCCTLLVSNISDTRIYRGYGKTDEALSTYYHLPVVCIVLETWDLAAYYWQIFEFEDKVLYTKAGDVDIDTIREQSFDDGMVIIQPSWYHFADIELIMNETQMDNLTYIVGLERHSVFVLDYSH